MVLLEKSGLTEKYVRIVQDYVAEWLRAWDTLTTFEATVYGRS